MNDYMLKSIKLAEKSLKNNDVPVGCVIVKNNKIISSGYNLKEKKQKITRHAEIIAIEKASKKLKTWHLDDCILYTTLKPCLMCSVVIAQSRIKKVIYALENNENKDYFKYIQELEPLAKKIKIEKGKYSEESLKLLQNFFQKQRKK